MAKVKTEARSTGARPLGVAVGGFVACLALVGLVLLLPGCSSVSQKGGSEAGGVASASQTPMDCGDRKLSFGSLCDYRWSFPFLSDQKSDDGSDGPSPSVNAYLWRAGLGELKCMPLTYVDARSGIVISDWHAFDKQPHRCFKVTMFVKSSHLQDESIEITVHRRNHNACVVEDKAKARQIKDVILDRARSLRTSHNKD